MRVCVWKTGHPIADTVAEALREAFKADVWPTSSMQSRSFGSLLHNYDFHIGYGILRGVGDVFKECERQNLPWLHLDKGYTNPRHYSGNYRISYRGTQARWHEGIPKGKWIGELEPRRMGGEYHLICLPTQHVIDFFRLGTAWLGGQPLDAKFVNYEPVLIRGKDCSRPLDDDLAKAKSIITFNSSVGWKAIRRGIPCLSDINHSLVGSFYGETDLQKLLQKFHEGPDRRQELFDTTAAHDFTLEQIKRGDAWPLLNHYIAGSASIAGKLLPPTFASIQSGNGLKAHYQSNT